MTAVLFGAGFCGETRSTLCPVCEIWMSPDQSELLLRRGLFNEASHRVEQLAHPIKRPYQSGLHGYPGRIFEDIAESGDKVVPAASIQIGETF